MKIPLSCPRKQALHGMRRRDVIALLGGVAAAATMPRAAQAQRPALPVIGFLHSASLDGNAFYVTAFRNGLKDVGFVEGGNLAVEYRWAAGDIDRVPALAADLIGRQVTVIAADTRGALALKQTRTTTPVVFSSAGDPVKLGLVASLNRPGGNMTGVSFLITAAVAKRLELLHKLIPTATKIGFLVNPDNFSDEIEGVKAAGHALGLQTIVLNVRSERDFDQAFATLTDQRASALYVGADPLFLFRRDELVALAAWYAIPTIYYLRQYAVAGGLISYGTSLETAERQVGGYVGRILRGAKPAELPVMQSVRFELVINLKAAKSLGIEVPLTLQVAADEVIE
jgi:putative ABC transport system substrate-binding protein